MKTVHQIWIGPSMPAQDMDDVADIKERCLSAGIGHKLWGLDDLMRLVGDERLREAIATASRMLPLPLFASLATDYFRYLLLSDTPGTYMDTDVVCSKEVDGLPELPHDLDVSTCTEKSHPENANTCILNAETAKGCKGLNIAAKVAANTLVNAFAEGRAQKTARHILNTPFSLVGFIGPGFFRKAIIPYMRVAGIRFGKMPLELASSCDCKSLLWHRSGGKWCGFTRRRGGK